MPKATSRDQCLLLEELPAARPFVKWVGGKGQLLAQLRPLMPTMFGRYFESFVGGAALFFAVRPARASLSDVNDELIDCYRAVQDDVEGVITALQEHRYEQQHYYDVRDIDPNALSLVERAARTIFLNKTGFNGLYRVNQSGKFNVPFGRHASPRICDQDNLRSCNLALQDVELHVRDFRALADDAKRGDFVYFDPPYVPVSETAAFTAYAPGGFTLRDQQELAELFVRLSRKGVYAMLSNSDTALVRELYADFLIEEVFATRNVNSKGEKRGLVSEVIVRNYHARGATVPVRTQGGRLRAPR